MNLVVRNTSRYPEAQVKWLVGFALRYVRGEAIRCGWVEKLDRYPVQVTVTNTTRGSYRGRSLGVRYFDKHGKRPTDQDCADLLKRRCFLVRVGAPSRFPTNSKYARYNRDDMPDATLNDWQEAVVGVAAHELTHTRYNYATGDRKGDEIACELTEVDCVAQFRRERAAFDEFVANEVKRGEDRQVALAAKKSPQAVAERKLKDAAAKLVRWQRKQKLANTKVKHYTRVHQRASNAVNKLGGVA